NSPLTCVLNRSYHWYCPATNTVDEFCYTWTLHPIASNNFAPQAWGPFFDQRLGDLRGQAGTIGHAPVNRAVVNTPTCFWIDGMGIPVEQDLTLVLPSAADASGRMIFYTFLARIRFLG